VTEIREDKKPITNYPYEKARDSVGNSDNCDSQEDTTQYIGGIPSVAFVLTDEEKTEQIKGLSGRELLVTTSPFEIVIKDRLNPMLHFTRADYDETDNSINASIFTAGFNGDPREKHPDLHATKFLSTVYKLFRDKYGEIKAINGSWYPDSRSGMSVNYDSFINYIREEKERIDFDQLDEPMKDSEEKRIKAEAAKQTWTGRFANSLGYTEVEFKYENNPNGIYCKFKKPQS